MANEKISEKVYDISESNERENKYWRNVYFPENAPEGAEAAAEGADVAESAQVGGETGGGSDPGAEAVEAEPVRTPESHVMPDQGGSDDLIPRFVSAGADAEPVVYPASVRYINKQLGTVKQQTGLVGPYVGLRVQHGMLYGRVPGTEQELILAVMQSNGFWRNEFGYFTEFQIEVEAPRGRR